MLGIKLSGSGDFLDTKDVAISYTLRFPNLKGDNSDGSYIFNFTLPATDFNKRLCKFPLRIEAAKGMTTEVNIEVYFRGIAVWSGTMLAKFARPGEIEVQIGIGRGEFNYEAAGKKLGDVMVDEEYIIGQYTGNGSSITDIDHVVSKKYPETNYTVFPVKVNGLCDTIGEAFKQKYNSVGYVNDWDVDDQKLTEQVNFNPLINNEPGQYVWVNRYNIYCPFVYNNHILKSVFSSLGFILENNPLTKDEDLNSLVVFNNQTLNTKRFNKKPLVANAILNDPFTWPPIYQNVNLFFGYRYDHSLMPNPKFNLKDQVPDVLVKDYVRSLEQLLFMRCFVDNRTRKVKILFLKDIILSKDYEDVSDKVIKVSERKMEFDKISKLVQNYDSNDGQSGNFKSIDKFDSIPDVLYSVDIPAANPNLYENKIIKTRVDDKYYHCETDDNTFTNQSHWNFYCYGYFLENVISEQNSKEWITNCSGIFSDIFVFDKDNYSLKWKVPVVDMDFKFYDAYKTNDNKCDLRFLFYRGLQDARKTSKPTKKIMVLINPGDYTTDGNPDFQNSAAYNFLISQLPQNSNNVADFIMNQLLSNLWPYDTATSYITSHIGYADTTIFINQYCTFSFIINPDPNSYTISFPKYPFASYDVYGLEGQKIPEANLSLKWDGEYGIYERFAKEFIYWFNNIAKPVTILIQPTVEDLFTDFSKKKRINGIDYIFDEIRGEIKGDTMSVAEVDAWSC